MKKLLKEDSYCTDPQTFFTIDDVVSILKSVIELQDIPIYAVIDENGNEALQVGDCVYSF